MNKVFKVIWNHATQTWTAVSELGHAKGKTKSKKIVKLTALAGAVIGSLAASQSAIAATDLRTNDAVNIALDNVPSAQAGRHAVSIGPAASAKHQDAIAIGHSATANWTNTISIGNNTLATQDHAVAIGSNTTATGVQSVTLGSFAGATANLTIAVGAKANATKESAIAVGSNAGATGDNSVALGQTATASNNNAIAIGTKEVTSGNNAVGIGAFAESTAERSTALGMLSQAKGKGSFAGGASAQATGENSVAIGGAQDGTLGNKAGTAANATGNNSIALGTQSIANGENSIAQGKGANAALENSIAIGTNSVASGISIGNEASTIIPDSIAIGHKSNVDGGAEGVAIGNEATNGGASFAAAVGATSGANANYSVALGYNAVANAEYSVALGAASEAGDDFVESTNATINGIEYKNFAASSSQFNNLDMGMAGAVVSVGTKGYERQIKNVAAGVVDSNSTDAINGSQLYAVADTLATKINNHHWNVGDNNGTVVNGVYHKDQVNFVNGNVTTVKVVDASSSGKSTNSLPGEKSGPNITNVSYDVNVGKGLKIEGNKIVTNIVAGKGVTFDEKGDQITINAQSTGGAASSVVSGNENTLNVTTNASNPSEYIVTPVTGSLSVTPKGKIDEDAQGFEDNGQKLTTIQTTRDMVNKAHWNLQIAESSNPTNKGTAKITTENKTAAPVHAGDTVNIFAGKNINLERTGTDITISAKDASVDTGEIIPATNTTNTNNNGTVMAKDGDGDKFANITNVVNAINSAFWKIGEENSGTVTPKGNVTAGSQVNFSNGVGTIATVTADEANKTYKVQYDVNAGPGIEIPTDGANKGKVTVKVDNSTVTINDAGQLVANSAWNANATGNVDGTSAAKAVKANATVNFNAGENLKVSQNATDAANQVYSFSLNQTLTNITSIENKAGGPKLTFGGNSINITGGNLDMDNNKITSLKPGTDDTDAVNLSQLKASRTVVTSNDGSVTVTPSENGLTKTYDLKVNLSNVAKSSWNVKSSAEGGAVAANHNATAKNITDSNTVEFKAGKNLTVEQVNGDTGANVTFALSNNITLDNNGSIKIGDTNITNGAVSNLTTHLVDPVKVDGDVENATKTADLAANLTTPTAADYRGKDAATVEDVLKAGWNLQANGKAVDAVTHGNNVNFASNDSSVEITPTTDGNTSTINLSVNATNVVKQVTGNVSANTTTGKAVVGKDGNEDTSANAGNKVATVGDVANTINNTGWITKTTDGANVTVNPGDRVEYVDGKGTTANVTVTNTNGQDVVNVTYDVKTDGTTITVKDGNVTANTGNIIEAKPDGDNAGKVTVTTGDENKVATVKNVADAINSAGWIVNTGKADNQDSFKTEAGTPTKVGAGDKVNFQAGKNLEVKRDGQNIIYATSEDLDAKTITVTTVKVGKDGKDGVDGSIGVTGKDGAAVAINGKDGSIGLTGPKGADGKDGASVTIKPEKGTTTVAERDGGKEINRVTYTDKDKDGNDIKREIATLDDGLKFTGDDGQTVNRTLGSNLNVKGGATTSTTAKNIRVTKAADGQGLDVNLANNIELDNNGSIKIGDTTVNQDGITINNGPSVTKGGIDAGGKTITNVAPGKNGTDAVNVDQLRGSLTNIQGDIHKARKEGRAGIAGANAAAGLPQVYLPGKSMVAASAGTFKGQNALAVGYSRSSDNGKVIFKLQGNANTQGDVGGSVGIGYQW
ncbi:YadA-like family protein [Haemophilus sp.]|uniref:YadA-like family protein n=2 Tax=Haemophilus TaxID=724 RepID=UPI0025C5A4C9|nr:YadA-like family protein [Haemophilus sp.]